MTEKKILLVEDDFLNRRVTKKVLVENGYVTLEAKNVREALDILKKETISLVILDINLGEGEQDGISLGAEISNKYSVPFIYLTAYESPEMIGKAVDTAPYSYLTKPFKNVDLIASVEVAIRKAAVKHVPKITVKDEHFKVELRVDDILFIESDGNYLLFYTHEKVYKTRSTIKKIVEELSPDVFIQTHRAYVVNKTKLTKLSKKHVMVSDKLIPVSENYLHLLEGMG
ncbi:LytR/AlgR family response regulator transcription factor [Phnomibacter ginsenosidimutans]|uniref:Response regulator n=1 Tax=Phnomibacter ginsenosidimutans TaxID=2676868 RepID=A0A6I6GSE3_9BACT|nr:response regulator transcription factor [Phnomibacter ginsenosidimutans]QGW28039.1 response regulator [Phnomibacter ginsenosidimutans]